MASRETVSEEEEGDEEQEEEYYATSAQLSAIFPDLEWEVRAPGQLEPVRRLSLSLSLSPFSPWLCGHTLSQWLWCYGRHTTNQLFLLQLLRCVSRMHHGNLELAANYLMAATSDGWSTEHPFSEDIGGLPEALPLSDSDSGSVAEPVTVQLGDSDFSSNEFDEGDGEGEEKLPSYRDVTSERLHPADLPPSYDSLLSEGRAGCVAVLVTGGAGRSEVTTRTTDSSQNKRQRKLGHRLRAKNMRKKGYLTGKLNQ